MREPDQYERRKDEKAIEQSVPRILAPWNWKTCLLSVNVRRLQRAFRMARTVAAHFRQLSGRVPARLRVWATQSLSSRQFEYR